MVSYQQPDKPVVLKSPLTLAASYLADAFPGSRFIHISRDPYSLIPSTVALAIAGLYSGFNRPKYDLPWLYEYIGDTFETLYEAFERQRLDIDESQLIDVNEDLVADAPGVIRSIYESLNLGDFDSQMAEPLQTTWNHEDYKVNQHDLPNELTELIESRCIPHLEKYGYQKRA